MNYFPPNETLANWPTCGMFDRGRRTSYKSWWMNVSEKSGKFKAMIWKFVSTGPYYFQNKCVSKQKSGFKTEKAAIDWCERTVDLTVCADGLPFQRMGSGI